MALPVSIPNTFANATTSIPLANLDANFVTIYNAVNGIGNGSEVLANVQVSGGTLSNVTLDNVTVDVETLSNVTLVNVTVTSGNATFTTANVSSIDVNGGTIDNTVIGGANAAAGSFTTITASGDGTFNGTGQVKMPVGTTAQRSGSPAAGMFRFNDDTDSFEGYNGTAWGAVGGGATGGGGDAVFIENDQTVTANYTIPATKNAMSTGPISINSGVTVTVSTGARWVVI